MVAPAQIATGSITVDPSPSRSTRSTRRQAAGSEGAQSPFTSAYPAGAGPSVQNVDAGPEPTPSPSASAYAVTLRYAAGLPSSQSAVAGNPSPSRSGSGADGAREHEPAASAARRRI